MGWRLSARGPILCCLGLVGCVADTYPLEYQLASVTVHLEDFEGSVMLLLSAPSGAVYDVVELGSPGTHLLKLPQGGALSIRFARGANGGVVNSVFELLDGDEITLRPELIDTTSLAEIFRVSADPSRTLAVDLGCGSGMNDFRVEHSELCQVRPEVAVLLDRALSSPRIAFVPWPTAGADLVVAPPSEQFTEVPLEHQLGITRDPRRPGQVIHQFFGVLGGHRFGPLVGLAPEDEENLLFASYPPLPYDHFEGGVIVKDGDQEWRRSLVLGLHPSSVDLRSDLPVITTFEADSVSARWSVDVDPEFPPSVFIGRSGLSGSLGDGAARVFAWRVFSARPSTTHWRRPDLPPELSAWAIAEEDAPIAYVAYAELPGGPAFDPRSFWLEAESTVRRKLWLKPSAP